MNNQNYVGMTNKQQNEQMSFDEFDDSNKSF